MRQAQINVRTRACSRTSIARTKQAALTHNVRGKELIIQCNTIWKTCIVPLSQGPELNGALKEYPVMLSVIESIR